LVDSQSNLNDVVAMAAIAKGDRAALADLYDRYNRLVFTLCLRMLKNRGDAEDVLIDVFSELWERSARYDATRGSPLSYLMTLTRSRAIDRMRSRGKLVTSELNDAFPPASDAPGPEALVDLGEQRERVVAAMGSLEPVYREAVELSFYDGLSHSEIAAKLNKPLGTIKTYIRQGLIRLRDRLRMDSKDLASSEARDAQ
jgi:RNA polymerase sigma-70 factor (ECF subfamily)